MSDEQATHYAERDLQALGGYYYYLRHIAAMTAEGSGLRQDKRPCGKREQAD